MTNRVFRDDFESADLLRWTGTTVLGGCTLTVQKSLIHHGGYAAEGTSDGSLATQRARVERTLTTSLAQVYARLYIRVKSHDISAANDRIYFIQLQGTDSLAFIGWRQKAAPSAGLWWELLTHDAAFVSTYGTSIASPVKNQWYCVELYWLNNAGAGIANVWIDGCLSLSRTAWDSSLYGNCSAVYMGLTGTGNTVIADVVFDCCAIDSYYIGPEVTLRTLRLLGNDWKSKCRIISNYRRKAGIMGLK